MSFPTAIIRDKFVYDGSLKVNTGNGILHKRATIPEITQLLRPVVDGANQRPRTRDQVGHWYEAQLIHYGLQPSKNKATAKICLLDALNVSRLAVPVRIEAVENAMQQEFLNINTFEDQKELEKEACNSPDDTEPASTPHLQRQQTTQELADLRDCTYSEANDLRHIRHEAEHQLTGSNKSPVKNK